VRQFDVNFTQRIKYLFPYNIDSFFINNIYFYLTDKWPGNSEHPIVLEESAHNG